MAHELAKRGSTAEAIEHYRAALKIDPKLPYRVVSSYQPFLYAIRITSSTNIRFRNVHCYSDSKVSFDNTVYDETHNIEIRQREFSWLTVSGNALPLICCILRMSLLKAQTLKNSPVVFSIFPAELLTARGISTS